LIAGQGRRTNDCVAPLRPPPTTSEGRGGAPGPACLGLDGTGRSDFEPTMNKKDTHEDTQESVAQLMMAWLCRGRSLFELKANMLPLRRHPSLQFVKPSAR